MAGTDRACRVPRQPQASPGGWAARAGCSDSPLAPGSTERTDQQERGLIQAIYLTKFYKSQCQLRTLPSQGGCLSDDQGKLTLRVLEAAGGDPELPPGQGGVAARPGRPSVRTDSAEGPPSELVQRAQHGGPQRVPGTTWNVGDPSRNSGGPHQRASRSADTKAFRRQLSSQQTSLWNSALCRLRGPKALPGAEPHRPSPWLRVTRPPGLPPGVPESWRDGTQAPALAAGKAPAGRRPRPPGSGVFLVPCGLTAATPHNPGHTAGRAALCPRVMAPAGPRPAVGPASQAWAREPRAVVQATTGLPALACDRPQRSAWRPLWTCVVLL